MTRQTSSKQARANSSVEFVWLGRLVMSLLLRREKVTGLLRALVDDCVWPGPDPAGQTYPWSYPLFLSVSRSLTYRMKRLLQNVKICQQRQSFKVP